MSLKIESEIKLDSEPCLAAWDGKLFVASEDGFIRAFDSKLSPGASWQAHAVQPFALAASAGKVYSASNDGGIRIWSEEGVKVVELPSTGGDVGALKVYGEEIYAGDDAGNVSVFEKNELKAKYNVLEEVKDLALRVPFLFTVRDLDVTVTEIKPDESKNRFVTRHTTDGRAPLAITSSYLLKMSRDGTTLQLHSASVDTTFKKLHEIKVSAMIVTSISAKEDFVWTGGWDGTVRRWQIVDETLKAAGEISLGSCVNAVAASTSATAYAALAGGRIVNIKAM